MSNLLFCLISVKFRVNPWLILILLLPSVSFPCKSVANSSASAYSSFREIPCSSVASLMLNLNSVANSLLSCPTFCLK